MKDSEVGALIEMTRTNQRPWYSVHSSVKGYTECVEPNGDKLYTERWRKDPNKDADKLEYVFYYWPLRRRLSFPIDNLAAARIIVCEAMERDHGIDLKDLLIK